MKNPGCDELILIKPVQAVWAQCEDPDGAAWRILDGEDEPLPDSESHRDDSG